MVFLFEAANVFVKANAEGDNVSLDEDMALELAEEAKIAKETKAAKSAKAEEEPEPVNTIPNPRNAKKIMAEPQGEQSNEKVPLDTELIPSVSSAMIVHSLDKSKGKDIAIEEEPLKQLIPQSKQSGSDPKIINLDQFNISGKKMTLEDAQAQLAEIKRLADLKVEQEKTKKKLKKLSSTKIQAQAQKLAEYDAKRKRMLEEYNHYVTFRADSCPSRRFKGVNRVGLVGFGSNGSGQIRVEAKNNIPEPDPI
nr:hypothetical protein [Tanacetum cinerariifolium]